MEHDVFISYASKDKRTADAVCASLESAGIGCWIAPRDIIAGNYGAAIIKAIKVSKMMVLLLSSYANESSQVRREVERAVSKGLIIYPIRIEEVEPSEELELFISSEQWLDAWTPPIERHLEQLSKNVKYLLLDKVNTNPFLSTEKLSSPPKKHAYEFDVFISYSTADCEWAEKLSTALSAKGVKTFLDVKRLTPGSPWETSLTQALQNSQHLLVLWSKDTENSNWVRRELGIFEATILDQLNRRLVFLLLEGDNPAYRTYQMIYDLKEAKAYDTGIDHVNPQVWNRVISTLIDAMGFEFGKTPFLGRV